MMPQRFGSMPRQLDLASISSWAKKSWRKGQPTTKSVFVPRLSVVVVLG